MKICTVGLPVSRLVRYFWVFVHEEMKKYLIYSDDELGDRDRRWDLEREGFELLWDSAFSRNQAIRYMNEFYPEYEKLETFFVPVTFREACDFINLNHRHHLAPQGLKFALGLSNGNSLIGVLTAGRPVARHRDDGYTLEVTRLCVKNAYIHSCSKLYSAAKRIAKELGYKKLITYTLKEEQGSSVRAAGFQLHGKSPGGSWSSVGRKRNDNHPITPKNVWMLNLVGN